jgi:hypothetical protein
MAFLLKGIAPARRFYRITFLVSLGGIFDYLSVLGAPFTSSNGGRGETPLFYTMCFQLVPQSPRLMDMADKDVTEVLTEKGTEIKKMFKDIKANLEQWKFSVEETKEGMRIEIHAVALVKRKE